VAAISRRASSRSRFATADSAACSSFSRSCVDLASTAQQQHRVPEGLGLRGRIIHSRGFVRAVFAHARTSCPAR
jgi:hypothetical protein